MADQHFICHHSPRLPCRIFSEYCLLKPSLCRLIKIIIQKDQTMNILFFFVLFGSAVALESCDQTISLTQMRTALKSSITISKQPRFVCVLVPKSLTQNSLSISFIPTHCVAYSEDLQSVDHPTKNDTKIYRVQVARDSCQTEIESQEEFVVALKEMWKVSEGNSIDLAIPLYFKVSVSLSIIIFLVLVSCLKGSDLLNQSKEFYFNN